MGLRGKSNIFRNLFLSFIRFKAIEVASMFDDDLKTLWIRSAVCLKRNPQKLVGFNRRSMNQSDLCSGVSVFCCFPLNT